MAAMFSIEITGSMYFSLFPALNSMIVSGTKMISDTSFVTNIDEKNTQQIRKNDSPGMVMNRFAKRMNGRKMFSCLKPSSTVSIMNSVPSVRQSMPESRSLLGGVMNIAMTAAASARVSIISFLKKAAIRFKTISLSIKCARGRVLINVSMIALCKAQVNRTFLREKDKIILQMRKK